MKKRIAVLSDTHGILRPEVSEIVKNCSAVLHAGDIGSQAVLDVLSRYGLLYAVRGNNDREWAASVRRVQEFSLYGFQFYMVHEKKHLPQYLPGKQIVIYGHSHKYEEEIRDGKLFLNPGSCGPGRFGLPLTMAVLSLEDNSYTIEKVELDPR